jgi:alpha-beta hydrolase superfamily lysophospholipase
MIERTALRIAVDDMAPPGVATLAARVVVDRAAVADRDQAGERPVVVCCFPGGGMSARYFELAGHDMAGHLAAAGFVVVMIDHPAVGGSDTPDDPWTLVPETVADVDAAAAARAVAVLGPELGLALDDPIVLGLGHSMGAMLVVYQQARSRPYAGLVLLGYSGRGLPEVLSPAELAVAGDPDQVRATIVELARARFGRPLVTRDNGGRDRVSDRGDSATSPMLVGPAAPTAMIAALAAAAAPLLASCGLTSMLPGSNAPELAAIDVPVLLSIAEHDIVGPTHEAPGYLPGSPDVTLHVLPGAFHNSNVATGRERLWDRIALWATTVPDPRAAWRPAPPAPPAPPARQPTY